MERDIKIRKLNELFAEEVEAAIRYLHLAVTLKGLDRLTVEKVLQEGLKETLEHAQVLGEKIVELGSAPRMSIKLELPAERCNGTDALRHALAFEQEALSAYRELLADVGDDVALEEFVRAQIATESRHVAGLSLLLEK